MDMIDNLCVSPRAASRAKSSTKVLGIGAKRVLSLPKSVVAAGGIEKYGVAFAILQRNSPALTPRRRRRRWNSHPSLSQLQTMLSAACTATTVAEALVEIKGIMLLGHNLWAYAYLRTLGAVNPTIYYGLLAADPALLLPVAYTPTVGEACQKFGLMPFHPRGCYVSLEDRGNLKAVLAEYAVAMLPKAADGTPECQCIVFSDGGRILGLGDLGAWGMGIPMGKLDLYTVCGGFDPSRTIPVIIDAGCYGPEGNSAGLTIRDHELYTGAKTNRVTEQSAAGTTVNKAYYGKDSFIGEFLGAARELFGPSCLLQFEDFNSNDAFPLLAEYRESYLTYNDDIQGTASVAVAAVLGGIKIQKPEATDLVGEARRLRFLFHGAGSANLGGASLLINEAKVPADAVACTNSRGLIWKSGDSAGTYKNDEQRAVALNSKPPYAARAIPPRNPRAIPARTTPAQRFRRAPDPPQVRHGARQDHRVVQAGRPHRRRRQVARLLHARRRAGDAQGAEREGRGGRAADHLRALEPEDAGGDHRRRRVRLLGRQGDLRQRHALPGGGRRRPGARAGAGEQLLHLPGHVVRRDVVRRQDDPRVLLHGRRRGRYAAPKRTPAAAALRARV